MLMSVEKVTVTAHSYALTLTAVIYALVKKDMC